MEAEISKKQIRLQVLERQIARIQRASEILALRRRNWWRLQVWIVLAGTVVTLAAGRFFSWLALACPLILIGLLVYSWRKQRALQLNIQRYAIWLRVKKTHMARMRLDWENIPSVENHYEADHPFERDLDISGRYSLHQLVNTAYSDGGRERLRQWLLTKIPDSEVIAKRQLLVRELTPLASFRDKLQMASYRTILNVDQQKDRDMLLLWLELPFRVRPPLYTIIISCLLSAGLCITALLYYFASFSLAFVLVIGAIDIVWFLLTAKYRTRLFEDASMMYEILKQLNAVFTFLEKYPYGQHQRLKQLCSPFHSSSRKPSALLRQLRRIAQWAQATQIGSSRQTSTQSVLSSTAIENQAWSFFLNALIPLDMLLAYQLARCKDAARHYLPQWLDTWYELECLCSLANFAYLNPDFSLPEILDSSCKSSSTILKVEGLGHPLIEDEYRIVNNVSFDHIGTILLITGSNMAGKSTFLRTIGINLCLANAGGPVNATSFQTIPFELRCCIRVNDSLTEGYSYFYAEVKRLREILMRLQEEDPLYPVLFLIDEIFKGTNNRERLIGSFAYIHALAEYKCSGAISTHDLELVKLADDLSLVQNFHFREEIVGEQMIFNYHLYPGPCPTTNALKIMQVEGLPTTWKGQGEGHSGAYDAT